MNIFTIVFIIFILAVIVVSGALFWHWKTYMPERVRGASAFIIYGIGLVVLFGVFWSVISQ